MRFRSGVLALLLFGSLLPFGQYIQIVAAAVAAPMVLWELARVRFAHRAVLFVLPLFAVLLVPGWTTPPQSVYGIQKLTDLQTLSLFTAMAAVIIRNRAHLLVFARTWVWFAAVLAAISLFGGVGEAGIAGRATGFGSNPIGLARPVASGLITVFWLATRREIAPWRAIILSVLMTGGLFATGSKGPLLAALFGVAVVGLFDARYGVARVMEVGALLGMLYLAVSNIASLRDSRIGQFILSPTDVSDPIRSEAITRSLAAISVNPGGFGWGNWSPAVGDRRTEYPHNIWLETAVEAGVMVAAMLILAVAIVCIRLLARVDRSSGAALALAWIACEVTSASLSADIRARSLWFFLTLGWLVARWPETSAHGDPLCRVARPGRVLPDIRACSKSA